MKKFAQELGKYIDQSGIKQTRIATSAGISYNYLQRLLSGSRNPSDQVVYKLAEALHLSSEQTGNLLASAGYAPPLNLLTTTDEQSQEKSIVSASHVASDEHVRIAQHIYSLARDVPESLQSSFLNEMDHLLGYARYKYVLSGNANVLELHRSSQMKLIDGINPALQEEQSQLDMIARIVGTLSHGTEEEEASSSEELSQPPQAVDEMLLAIDKLLGHILTGRILPEGYQSQVILRIFDDMLHHGAPWEIRHRIAEVLPDLFKLDTIKAESLMKQLRLDRDEIYGVDIRRRVIETLPDLFNVFPRSISNIIQLIQPVTGDDIYVALATIEACEDIQASIKNLLCKELAHLPEISVDRLQQGRVEISRIERQLLLAWNNVERECLQFSIALHNLLAAPDTLLISLQEGLEAKEKLIQLVAARYLERVLPSSPLEILELYKTMLHATERSNLHRTVAKALPALLRLLKEASLPIRALTREVVCDLAMDPDVHVRRAVADYALQIFYIDREFLLILLRLLHKDKDHVVRYRLRPSALHLAQTWLTWYAETAGLIETKSLRGMHKHLKRAFWELK